MARVIGRLDRRDIIFGLLGTPISALATTASCALPSWPLFSPLRFGARGDGAVDDTLAVQKACEAAQAQRGGVVLDAGRTFGIRHYIYVRNGIRSVTGGGTLKVLKSAPVQCGLVLAGEASGYAGNVVGCEVSNIRFDANGMNATGIYGQNVSRCTIRDNLIIGLTKAGAGILLRNFANGREAGRGNRIVGNRVEGEGSGINENVIGIGVDAQLDLGEDGDTRPFWLRNFTPPAPFLPAADNVIEDNVVTGGYYGIALLGARGTMVRGNRCAMNTRSISLQGACDGNTLVENDLRESRSSSILMSYGSRDNLVERNRISSDRANGEGMIEATIGSTGNRVAGNDIRTGPSARPFYHLYCAVMSDGCRFEGNRLSGRVDKAYIGVESAWNGAAADNAHRARGAGALLNGFARRGMADIVVSGNRIDGDSPVPAIYIAQVSDGAGTYPLARVTASANSLNGKPVQPTRVSI